MNAQTLACDGGSGMRSENSLPLHPVCPPLPLSLALSEDASEDWGLTSRAPSQPGLGRDQC